MHNFTKIILVYNFTKIILVQKIFFENHAEDLQFRMEMLFGNKNEICFMQDIEAMSEPTPSFLSRTHNLSSFILKNIDKYV